MMKPSFFASASALCLGLLAGFGAGSQADAAAKCIKGDRKAPYTIGWANIYSVPTWMKQTQGTIEAEVEAAEEARAWSTSWWSPTPRATPTRRSSRSSR